MTEEFIKIQMRLLEISKETAQLKKREAELQQEASELLAKVFLMTIKENSYESKKI